MILSGYKGEMPLAHYLKIYFKQYPVLGSRDRRLLSDMAYSWYRASRALAMADNIIEESDLFQQAIFACLRICGHTKTFERLVGLEKEAALPVFDIYRIFTQDIALSDGIERTMWLNSLLKQPRMFIRVRKRKHEIISALQAKGIVFIDEGHDCLSLPNQTALEGIVPPECYAIQDASSQATGIFFNPQKHEHWFDCCSGAGGKSLLLMDMEPTVHLTVSDVRPAILRNLAERFRLYGYRAPTQIIADMADQVAAARQLNGRKYDNIICDVPCTGSGTWARTPEEMYFFNIDKLQRLNALQLAIATNVARSLKPGGRLIYITCSVFAKENEETVAQVADKTGLKVKSTGVINGLAKHADSMYVAELLLDK